MMRHTYRSSTAKVNTLRAISLTIAILCILGAGLTVPANVAHAGFTPTPPVDTATPLPTNTPIPPANTPTPRPGGGGGGGGDSPPAGGPQAAAAAPAPLPQTGKSGWWLTLVLLLWGGSMLLVLPMIGPIRRMWAEGHAQNAGRRKQQ